MRRLILAAALAVLLTSSGARAQDTPAQAAASEKLRATAAGYKALTICSALKSAEAAGAPRTLEHIEANELSDIYPELDALARAMPVEVLPARVSVAWDAVMPPRSAVWRAGRGCAIMPIGWTGDPVADSHLPVRADPGFPVGQPRDPAAVAAVMNRVLEGGYGDASRTTGVVVLQDDRLVAEAYARGFGPDTPQRTWSAAKSIAGTLVGVAVHRNGVDVNAPAAVPHWGRPGDPRQAITLDHLMRMASGLTSDTAGNDTGAIYYDGVGVDEQAIAWPLITPPGTRFRYANNDTMLATLAIAPTFADHPPSALFERLGMYHTVAETDWRGNYISSSQIWTTARDLARFGLLYLNDGMVGGERVLPEGWRQYVSRPSGPQPPGGRGYGATFWLLNSSEGIPADAFVASGNRGQHVIIVPSRRIVIVRRGEDAATGTPFNLVAFASDMLAALN